MKIRLLTLVGLAISFAVPTIAQQTNTPDRSGGYRETLGRQVPESAFQQQPRHGR